MGKREESDSSPLFSPPLLSLSFSVASHRKPVAYKFFSTLVLIKPLTGTLERKGGEEEEEEGKEEEEEEEAKSWQWKENRKTWRKRERERASSAVLVDGPRQEIVSRQLLPGVVAAPPLPHYHDCDRW